MVEDFKNSNILVVDDEEFIREFICENLKSVLREKGIVEANDGQQAFMKMANQDFDLVIVDLKMPKLGGIDLIKSMKKKTQFKNIPVIVISGAIKNASMKELIEIGVKVVITKPFNPELLMKNVIKSLEETVRSKAKRAG